MRLFFFVPVLIMGLSYWSAQNATGPEKSCTETLPTSAVRFEMVWIPEGGFWIGKTEVTWDEFLTYCAWDDPDPAGADAVSRPSRPLDVEPYDRGWGKGKRPAVGMSWNAARKYCEWLSLVTGKRYRLPTEREWELAAGKPPPSPLSERAWHAANSGGKTQEVGKLAANEHGLHDMLGNVWEYCANPYDSSEPPRAVLRGGSWKDEAGRVTPSERLGFDNAWTMRDPNFPPGVWWAPDADHVGFRVLREAEAP